MPKYTILSLRSSIWKPERWEAHGMPAFEQHEIHTLAELNARYSSKEGKCAAGNKGVPKKECSNTASNITVLRCP